MEQQQGSRSIAQLRMTISLTGVVATLVIASACTSSKPPKSSPETSSSEKISAARTPQSANPGIDLNCIYDRLRNPPESFHYVYKKDDSDGSKVHQEADVSQQAIDGFRMQADGTPQPIHAVRSDPQGWQSALAGLTGISGMSGTVSTFKNSSAVQREPDGNQVNGYPTIHYSVDTARWDETTRRILGNFALGPGGFDKGDVWVMSDGCPVKIVLDDEMHKKDGTLLGRVHYEEAMVKK